MAQDGLLVLALMRIIARRRRPTFLPSAEYYAFPKGKILRIAFQKVQVSVGRVFMT